MPLAMNALPGSGIGRQDGLTKVLRERNQSRMRRRRRVSGTSGATQNLGRAIGRDDVKAKAVIGHVTGRIWVRIRKEPETLGELGHFMLEKKSRAGPCPLGWELALSLALRPLASVIIVHAWIDICRSLFLQVFAFVCPHLIHSPFCIVYISDHFESRQSTLEKTYLPSFLPYFRALSCFIQTPRTPRSRSSSLQLRLSTLMADHKHNGHQGLLNPEQAMLPLFTPFADMLKLQILPDLEGNAPTVPNTSTLPKMDRPRSTRLKVCLSSLWNCLDNLVF